MNLMESLKKTQTQRAAQPLPGAAANLRQLLAAKSGKAGAVSGPAASNIQESQALADASAAATAQQQAAQVNVAGQEQQSAAVAQQAAQNLSTGAQQRSNVQQQLKQGMQKIDNDLERLKTDINSKEGQQALSQLMFSRRLADNEYKVNLDREGKLRRLDNAQNFQLEAGKAAFENWKEIFAEEDRFKKLMTDDNQAFQRELAEMSMAEAEAILNSSMVAANRQAQIESYGNLASAFVQSATTQYDTGKVDAQGKPIQSTLTQDVGNKLNQDSGSFVNVRQRGVNNGSI